MNPLEHNPKTCGEAHEPAHCGAEACCALTRYLTMLHEHSGAQCVKRRPKRLMIGWRETISLPDLGIHRFAAKNDTGALTTALHASDITCVESEGLLWVRFYPDHDGINNAEPCVLPVLHKRDITNTGGIPESRLIVSTTLQIGPRKAQIEVSLTDRSDMTYPIIIGRSAMRLLRLTIDPTRSWLQSQRNPQVSGKDLP